jgi:hypothetical protein
VRREKRKEFRSSPSTFVSATAGSKKERKDKFVFVDREGFDCLL